MKWIVLLVTFSWQALPAQVSLDTLLRRVADNNREVQAALSRYEAEVLASKVGNSPPNPEVEYGYMWGDPASVGDRIDFAVTQTFAFPTAYTSRSKLRKIGTEQAALRLASVRQEVMAQARKSWIEAVYLNNKRNILEVRLRNAELVNTGFQRKFETGEANQLQRNQAFLKYTVLKNDYYLTLTAIDNISNELKNLAGGEEIIIPDTILPQPADLNLDTLLAAYGQGPVTLWYNGEVEKWAQQKDVIFNNKLPRLMAGYYSESILGIDMRGVKAGITIPLWGNAHSVNQAKAARAMAESDAWQYRAEERTRITNLYGRWASLKIQVEDLVEAVQTVDNEILLVRSLETGEMSLTEYFYESDFFFQSRLMILDTWREVLTLEAELLKVYE
jgi:outer membrane protein TolC